MALNDFREYMVSTPGRKVNVPVYFIMPPKQTFIFQETNVVEQKHISSF